MSRSRGGLQVSHRSEFGLNSWLVEEQRQRYLDDAGSVDQVWRDFFDTPAQTFEGPADDTEHRPEDDDSAIKAVRLAGLIHSYRVRGQLSAATDPLAPERQNLQPDLDIRAHGLEDEDLEREFAVGGFAGKTMARLRDVVTTLQDAYRRTVGIEYMHIRNARERSWIQQHVEAPQPQLTRAEQQRILYRLGAAEAFETFLHVKYVGQKRYSLEGGESAIVLLDALLHHAIGAGMREAVIGMAHRGRLNVLANIVGKSYAQMFHEFEDAVDIRSVQGSGDVKYHLGAEGVFRAADGATTGPAASPTATRNGGAVFGVLVRGVIRMKVSSERRGGLEQARSAPPPQFNSPGGRPDPG